MSNVWLEKTIIHMNVWNIGPDIQREVPWESSISHPIYLSMVVAYGAFLLLLLLMIES